jgi:hypothetical protein
MGWLWDELIAKAGSESEAEVKAGVKQWRTQTEPLMRELIALKLAGDVDRASVTIHIRPGLPVRLETLDAKLTEAGLTLLGINKAELETFISSGHQITNLLHRLDQYGEPWRESTNERVNIIQTSIDLVSDLNEIARQGSFLQKLFQYDEDILGVYLCPPRGYDGIIELYWGVIGAVAQLLGCSIRALTGLILIHELAHAYTHSGADIEGRRWKSYSFQKSDVGVKEGLAQYYTCLIARRLHEKGESQVHSAYEQLLKFQTQVYKTHLPWLDHFSPEIVRAAMLESRLKGDGVTINEFEECLRDAAKRLSQVRQRRLSL